MRFIRNFKDFNKVSEASSNFKVLLRTSQDEPIGRKIRLGGKRDAFQEVWEKVDKMTWMNLKTKKKLDLNKFARHANDYHMTNRDLQFESKLPMGKTSMRSKEEDGPQIKQDSGMLRSFIIRKEAWS